MKCLSLPIKGTYYYQQDASFLKQELIKNQAVFLVEEKKNKFDLNAIQIWVFMGNQSSLLGYVPRPKTSFIHFINNNSLLVKAELCQIITTKQQLKLKICLYYSISINKLFHFYWWRISSKLKRFLHG